MRNLRQGPAVRTQRQPLEGADQSPLPSQPADGHGDRPWEGDASQGLHSLLAHARRDRLTTPLYVALGCFAFLVAAAGQYLIYSRLLQRALAEPEPRAQRAGLLRWVLATGAWQGLTVLVALAYFLILRSRSHGLAWVAPPLGLLLGSLLPLQLAAGRLGRAGLKL
jgi:hypothetical protein